MVVSAFQAAARPRLITKGGNYTNKRSSEGKFEREALQVIAFPWRAYTPSSEGPHLAPWYEGAVPVVERLRKRHVEGLAQRLLYI
jgi:hypothetical protein